MLGWHVFVHRLEQVHPANCSSVLASWKASVGGLDWLEELAKSGIARRLTRGGYPTTYTVAARDLLPLLGGGMPPKHSDFPVIGDDYVMPSGWVGNIKMYSTRMAACQPDELLSVAAWDQS